MTDYEPQPYRPDYASPPGETLRQILAEIDLSQSSLAQRANLSTKHVNQIIKGFAPITPDTALTLERITGVTANFWNRLELDYRQHLVRLERQQPSAEERQWLSKLPLRVLKEREHLPQTDDERSLLNAAFSFFGVADLQAWHKVWQQPAVAYKRTATYKSSREDVAAWLRIGELAARSREVSPYSKDRFREVLRLAKALSREDTYLEELQELCASAGVVLLYVPEVKDSRANGASAWINPSRALILVSDRYKTDDHFWFTFFHEAGHILLHSKKETYVDYGPDKTETEQEADRFAATTLISPKDRQSLPSLRSITQAQLFADAVGVCDGVIVGQLQREGLWDWNKGNALKRSVRFASQGCISW